MAAENTCPYNSIDCPCTKDCPRHGKCCECVMHHKAAGNKLPACLRGIDWERKEAAKIPQPIEQKTKPKLRDTRADLRVQKLVKVVGKQTVPRKYIMAALGLKQTSRQSFIEHYLKPSVQQGFISFAYPVAPNKPEQKYRLTDNGLLLYSQLTGKDWL